MKSRVPSTSAYIKKVSFPVVQRQEVVACDAEALLEQSPENVLRFVFSLIAFPVFIHLEIFTV